MSDSSGTVSILQLDGSGALRRISSYKAHKFEAWTAGFDYWNPNIVYSGEISRICLYTVGEFSTPFSIYLYTHEDVSKSRQVYSLSIGVPLKAIA